MSMIVETAGFFFGVIGSIMLGISLFDANWRVSSDDGSVIITSVLFENLWMSCATDSTGVYNCRDFPSLLALPGHLQAFRALIISSLIFGLFSCLSGMIGLQCTKVAEGNSVLKGKFITAAGAISIFAGICAGISVSWYAFNITKDFFNPLYPGTKYEIGPALYLGWSGSLLDVVGGSLMCCSYKSQVAKAKKGYTYYFGFPNTVSSAKPAPQAAFTRYQSSSSISKYGMNSYV
ncbi:claudin-15-like [Aquarana catesbeiana]|uniref:claudin-15-like n=1 Tax=Aquarana catesbeiana TaxID=8400 RepID=UPI003CC9B27C